MHMFFFFTFTTLLVENSSSLEFAVSRVNKVTDFSSSLNLKYKAMIFEVDFRLVKERKIASLLSTHTTTT